MSLPIPGNIGCYHAGCANPVIGQCQGYPGHCGRFYCAEHSRSEHPKGVLCLECAQRFAKDREEKERKELEERLFQLYLGAAEKVPRTNFVNLAIGFVTIYLLVACGSLLFSADPFRDSSAGESASCLGMIIAGAIIGLYQYWIQRKAKREIAELSAILPNFKEFYSEWLKHKKAQEERDALWALFAAGFAIAATAAARERRISEIEEGVRRALK